MNVLELGQAGVENPLFYIENTDMLFGDAKKSSDDRLQACVGSLQDLHWYREINGWE